MATKKPSILWRYNRITGYWEAERSCIVGATCEEWLRVYSNDEPRELFKVAVKRPSGTSAKDKEKLWSMPPKKNPAPKRKTAARTQRAAESYVRRPSQITKKAPSTRLKKRRTVNLQSPRGVFPNPSRRPTQSAIFKKANELMREGYKRKQAFALAYSEMGEPKRERKNPDSVHFDIDVNSHNAKGAKARTRVNPARRKSPKTWIFVQKAYGKDDWSYLGYFDDTPDGSARAIEYAKAYHIKDPRAKIRVFTGPMK